MLESCFWPHDDCKSNIHSPLSSVFGLYRLLRKTSLAAKCENCFHQLVVDFVTQQFGAGQVVYSEFIKAYLDENS